MIHKKELRPTADDGEEEMVTYAEFHPYLLKQHQDKPHEAFKTFDRAVDEFFSKVRNSKEF